jgi:nucleoside-diphosphate-sugar epimerase
VRLDAARNEKGDVMGRQNVASEAIRTVAVFGATGTAGDGVLKAVINDADIANIHVITRRSSERIDSGVESGRIEMTSHQDYLDYSSLREVLSEVDAVYWALGTSVTNVTEEQYGVIHVDYPVAFTKEWLSCRKSDRMTFHFVSGMSVGANSRMMWACEKARAELALFDLAERTNMNVISYRPAYIVPSEERAGFGHNLAHRILKPMNLAIRSTHIGNAMLQVGRNGDEFSNRTILENRELSTLGDRYLARK